MPILPLENLQAGMTLKASVCDRSGRMLLPAGAELTDKHLKIFQTWGISAADVAADAAESDNVDVNTDVDIDDATDDPLVTAAAQEAVARLFIHNDPRHELIHELMRICTKRKVAKSA